MMPSTPAPTPGPTLDGPALRPVLIPTGGLLPERPEERTIEDLVAAELPEGDAVRFDGTRRNWLKHPPRDLFGLALSGGGIRSATFNLGLLQGLHEMKLLPAFDYVSTVSGGGYVGAWWTAWRSREEGREGSFPTTIPDGFTEPAEVRHLREFSNFLTPRLGIFSYDTGRLLVNTISSMIPSLLAALSVITLAMLAWALGAWLVFSDPGDDRVPPVVVLGLTVVALVAFEILWLRRKEPSDGAGYLTASLLALGLTGAAWWMIARGLDPYDRYGAIQLLPGVVNHTAAPDAGTYLLAPAAAWTAALLALIFLRWTFSRTLRRPAWRRLHRAADRVRSRLLFLAVAWTAVAVLWVAGVIVEFYWLSDHPLAIGELSGLTALLAAAFVKVQRLLAKEKQPSGGGKLLGRIKPLLPQILAYAVVLLMVVGVAGLIVAAWRAGDAGVGPGWIAAGAGVVTLLVLGLMDPNEVGFHAFYRARLSRAYAGASNDYRIDPATKKRRTERVPNRETEEVEGDDIPFDQLGGGARRPFHLVCLAANDLASRDDMANLSRGSASAVLSPVGCSVGSQWAPWSDYPVPSTLGAAVTASGAAFNTLMGSKSKKFGPAVTFLMAALNLRLGMWIAHPRTPRPRTRLAAGAPFYSEMFALASADGNQVHLSDGAHFENLAVYELIRRHCRVILASDCGQDGGAAFEDLGNLVRRVREDFGVDVRIDTRPVRPGEGGLASQYMVAGDIHYPDGDTGVLLFFKPAIVGGEPADVTEYRTRNAAFPHESTIDQWYDEAQWESYRRLGEHAVHTAFRTVLDLLKLERPDGTNDEALRAVWMEAFARARREWFPEPAGYEERLSHFAGRVAELEGGLREPGCDVLLHQVYKELGELDQQQKERIQLPSNFTTVAGGQQDGGAEPAAEGGGTRTAAPPRTGTAKPATDGLPAAEQHGAPLYLIRRALLLMEEVFESEDLDRNYSHPLYLGVMNWFARWAYAPLFRMWWPLLKTLYPQPFTRFLEKHFSLTAVDHDPAPGPEKMHTWIHRGGEGFAKACWVRQGNDPAPREREVISYSLRMVYQDQKPYRIQAAQVVVARGGGTLAWEAGDFFVPAGLWGVGIGSDFLKKLREGMPELGPLRHLVVRVAASGDGAAGKRWAANEMQLYRTAGFLEADFENGKLCNGSREIELPEGWDGPGGEDAQWMFAPVNTLSAPRA